MIQIYTVNFKIFEKNYIIYTKTFKRIIITLKKFLEKIFITFQDFVFRYNYYILRKKKIKKVLLKLKSKGFF